VLIYAGLILLVFAFLALAFILWAMSQLNQLDPAYDYLLLAWAVSVLLFMLGVVCRKLSCNNDR